ncbi:MAG: hypothetical protein KQH63_11150 [Desulfobulbaceae bacterium]|nr:hypothetical protein [Desulfobulbaceae bacterium]
MTLQKHPNFKYSSSVDVSHSLFRKRVIDTIISRKGTDKKCIIIEAQAGQGKTTLAAQFLHYTGTPFSWYQLDQSDSDPVFFISALIATIKKSLPGFRVPLLEKMIAQGELSPHESIRYAEILLGSLNSFLENNLYLVFDDLYLLEESTPTLSLIAHLVRKAPIRLRFMLLSRHPAWSPGLDPLQPADVCHVSNCDLALNGNEIAELFNTVFKQPVSVALVQALSKATEGWVMGLTLARRLLPYSPSVDDTKEDIPLSLLKKKDFRLYFQEEVLNFVPGHIKKEIFKLSLLRKIPLDLAEAVTGCKNIGRELQALVQLNFFIRFLGDEENIFVFHHLFGEIVRNKALESLTSDEVGDILQQAASWYEERKRYEEALAYLLDAKDYDAVQRLLQQCGSMFLAGNLIITLQTALKRIPSEIIGVFPWLSYFQGTVLLETEPPASLSWFSEARLNFIEKGDMKGELLASIMIVYFHAVVDCNFNMGNRYIRRAEELYVLMEQELDLFYRIQSNFTLAVGYCFFEIEMDKVEYFCAKADKLVKETGIQNLEAMVAAIYCQQYLFISNWRKLKQVCDAAGPLLSSPHVSSFNKTLLRIEFVTMLQVEGDFVNYQYSKSLFEKRFAEYDLALQSATGPWLMIYDADRAIAGAHFEHALDIIEQALGVPEFCFIPHFESYLLCYKSYALAVQGKSMEAISCAERALVLREYVGGREYRMLGWWIVGAAYVQLAMEKEAEDYLGKSINEAKLLQDVGAHGGARLHRAYLRISLGKIDKACEDISAVLKYLHENRNVRHVYCATPGIWQTVLTAAVKHNILADYAGELAGEILERAFLPDGSTIPLLSISTMGCFRLATSEGALVEAPDLTQIQKKFLALLLSSPGLAMEQEVIQTDLWPDSPPQKARSTFDNLMTRLRKILAKAVAPYDIRQYLVVEKGTVRLRNCRADFIDFTKNARKGLKHIRRSEPWQAGNAFYLAIRLWQGPYLTSFPLDNRGDVMQRELLELYLQCVLNWAEISADFGDPEEALEVAEKALHYEPIHEPLVRLLYSLYTRTNNPVKADRCLKDYKKALADEDFPPDEVEEIMEAFWHRDS